MVYLGHGGQLAQRQIRHLPLRADQRTQEVATVCWLVRHRHAPLVASAVPDLIMDSRGLGGSERVRQCHSEILLRGKQLGREVETAGGEPRDVG
jgi:hypothetical protein